MRNLNKLKGKLKKKIIKFHIYTLNRVIEFLKKYYMWKITQAIIFCFTLSNINIFSLYLNLH
jgi:hypothetical protein